MTTSTKAALWLLLFWAFEGSFFLQTAASFMKTSGNPQTTATTTTNELKASWDGEYDKEEAAGFYIAAVDTATSTFLQQQEKETIIGGEWDKSINIIEGDIASDLEENLFRLSLRWDLYPRKRWINNTIHYKIEKRDYGQREILLIESAIKTLEFLSCLRFVPWNEDDATDYLFIESSKEKPGCWSYIGRRGGKQTLSLRAPDAKSCHCLCSVGRILHEMMHALGFYHEHTRPDRDQYIQIVEDNVKRGKLKNFNKKSFDTTTTDFDYDYASIMHYGPYFFSKDKKTKTTIKPLQATSNANKIGQRNMLSKVDCMKLNHAFDCFQRDQTWNNQKIQVLCGVLGF